MGDGSERSKGADRADRMAAALRRNLRLRKAQARGRGADAATAVDPPADGAPQSGPSRPEAQVGDPSDPARDGDQASLE